eukprot:tig00021251_g19655.t1
MQAAHIHHAEATLGISLDSETLSLFDVEPLSFLAMSPGPGSGGSPGSRAAPRARAPAGPARPPSGHSPSSPASPHDTLDRSPAFSLSAFADEEDHEHARQQEAAAAAVPAPAPFAQNGFLYFAVPMQAVPTAVPGFGARSQSLPSMNGGELPANILAGKRKQETTAAAPGPAKRRNSLEPACTEAPASPALGRIAPGSHSLVMSGSVNAAYLERIQKNGAEGKFLPPWLIRPGSNPAPSASPLTTDLDTLYGAAENPAPPAPLPAFSPSDCSFATFSKAGGKFETLETASGSSDGEPSEDGSVTAAPSARRLPRRHPRPRPPPFLPAAPPRPAPALAPAPARGAKAAPVRPVYKGALPFELDEGLLRRLAAQQRVKLQQQMAVEQARAEATPRTAPAMPPSGSKVTREELVANFELPIQEVAKRLGRKLRSVTRWTEQADIVVQNRVPGFDHAAIARAAGRLRETRSVLYRNPAASIKDVTGAIRKLLVQPIQQRLNEMRAAAAAGGAARDDFDGEESEAEEKSGGVQMDDITTYLQSYLAAASTGPAASGKAGAAAAAAGLPLDLPAPDISEPEGMHACADPLVIQGAYLHL